MGLSTSGTAVTDIPLLGAVDQQGSLLDVSPGAALVGEVEPGPTTGTSPTPGPARPPPSA